MVFLLDPIVGIARDPVYEVFDLSGPHVECLLSGKPTHMPVRRLRESINGQEAEVKANCEFGQHVVVEAKQRDEAR